MSEIYYTENEEEVSRILRNNVTMLETTRLVSKDNVQIRHRVCQYFDMINNLDEVIEAHKQERQLDILYNWLVIGHPLFEKLFDELNNLKEV